MNRNYDDPMLTAFALGELEGDERAAVEARLEADPDAWVVVEEIRAAAGALSDAFEGEAEVALTDAQREALSGAAEIASASGEIMSPPGAPTAGAGSGSNGRVIGIVQRFAVAAGLLAMVGVGGWAVLSRETGDEFVRARTVGDVEVKTEVRDRYGLDHDVEARESKDQVRTSTPDALSKKDTALAAMTAEQDKFGVKVTSLNEQLTNERLRKEQLGVAPKNTPAGSVSVNPYAGRAGGAPKTKTVAGGLGVQPVWGYRGGEKSKKVMTLTPGQPNPAPKFSLNLQPKTPAGGASGPARPATATGSPSAVTRHIRGSGPVGAKGKPQKLPGQAGYFFGRRADQGVAPAAPPVPTGTPASTPAPKPEATVGLVLRSATPKAVTPPAADPASPKPVDASNRGGGGAVPVDNRGVDKDAEKRARDRLRAYRASLRQHNTESYGHIVENTFEDVGREPLSTFSIDVDTASYANVRRFLNHSMLPPKGALRIEECVNYFRYRYADPIDGHPFSTNVEVASCPWKLHNRLVRIGLKGREIPRSMRPASNFVFLIDVSGSMRAPNKLGLVKQSMRLLVKQFDERDRVAIVVYAGASGLALPSTPCNESAKIFAALDRMNANGSTNGAAGIRLAYQVAVQNFIEGGNNRVILCTDGDFNVGVSSNSELVDLITQKAKTGVFLSALGFGSGNLKDDKLEAISGKGNGNYHYIDSMREAKKVLGEQLSGTLITIAKDVKIQVEFNPRVVKAYRLLGYENRMLAAQDFNDDTKDAGEIGAGHTVTALYEVVPVGAPTESAAIDDLKYQKPTAKLKPAANSSEMLTVKLRYKLPEATKSTKIEEAVVDHGANIASASQDFRFAVAVAGFCMVLRDSAHRGNASLAQVIELAGSGVGSDESGRRAEFIGLAKKAQQLKK